MDKLKVAVVLEECSPSEGGGYSYYKTLLRAINNFSFSPEIDIVHLNVYDDLQRDFQFTKPVITVNMNIARKALFGFYHAAYRLIHRVFRNKWNKALDWCALQMSSIRNTAALEVLKKERVDLVYYLKPQEHLIDFPMIVTHWDVGHKSMYPFPEVAWDGNLEKKERYYKTIIDKAFLILCESEAGASELKHFYPVNAAKVRVLPLFAGDVVTRDLSRDLQASILSASDLISGEFFVYPAQFWPHKNHATLLKAFRVFLDDRKDRSTRLVLCGGDQGNLTYIKRLIRELSLDQQVLLPGFITNDALHTYYKNAIALVMPTFLGPTNIPLIEAAQSGCAIICSDFAGHREILGDTALYFNPGCAASITGALHQVMEAPLQSSLVETAKEHIEQSVFHVEKSIVLLDRFLQDLKPVRKAWGFDVKLLFAFAKISILSIN